MLFNIINEHLYSEWKGGGPDNQRLDRNGNLTASPGVYCCSAVMIYSTVYLQDIVKPTVFLFLAMVWLQAQMGPTTQVSFVWKHHFWATCPFQEHMAAWHHTGEQVSVLTFIFNSTFDSMAVRSSLLRKFNWSTVESLSLMLLCSLQQITSKKQWKKLKIWSRFYFDSMYSHCCWKQFFISH